MLNWKVDELKESNIPRKLMPLRGGFMAAISITRRFDFSFLTVSFCGCLQIRGSECPFCVPGLTNWYLFSAGPLIFSAQKIQTMNNVCMFFRRGRKHPFLHRFHALKYTLSDDTYFIRSKKLASLRVFFRYAPNLCLLHSQKYIMFASKTI